MSNTKLSEINKELLVRRAEFSFEFFPVDKQLNYFH